jgi:glycosidase
MVLIRRGWALLVALAIFGCATTPASGPVAQAVEPTRVAIALVRDEVHTRESDRAPEALLDAIVADLARRNLDAVAVGEGGWLEAVSAVRSTPGRLAALAEHAGGAPLVLLVETRATFYSQLSGRYRWTVDARLTLAPTADLGRAAGADVQAPAFLFYDHQREDEAIADVAGRVARQAGAMVDDALVAGWPGVPDAGTPTGATAAARAAERRAAEADRPETPHAGWRPQPAPAGDALYFAMVDRFARAGGDAGALEDPQGFYGGSLAGLRERLDWLEDLGVGSLWLSPVYLSREADFHGWGAFHGYWVEDHFAIWPRLGSMETLRGLSEDLSDRGMRLFLDVVVNHVGYEAPLVEDRPDWFNQRGTIEDWNDPEQLVFHDVHGLPDLNQDHPEVYEYLLDHARFWIDAVRPDGFRLDAVKHVPLSFWRRFNAAVKAHAGDDFLLLGEDLEGDPVRLSRTLHDGGFDALFDFPVHFALVDVFCRDAPMGRLASILSMDHLYGEDAGRRLVTFLDNHDLPRIVSACDDNLSRVKQALTTLAALRGTPALTWGTEVGLQGADEPANRAPMRFDADHPLHAHVKAKLALRREHPWLVDLETILHRVDDEVLVLVRPASVAYVLVVNSGDGPAEVTLPPVPEALVSSLTDGTPLPDGPIIVPPRSVQFLRMDTRLRSGLGPHLDYLRATHGTTTRPGPPREVIVRAAGAPEDGRLVLVGAGEALGHWEPDSAVRFDGDRAKVTLPTGLVAEYKLALVGDSETRWESGTNRYLLVPPGDEPFEVAISWRREG